MSIGFWASLIAYLKLYRAGFRISNSRMDEDLTGFEINRFYWNGKVIRDFADIDKVYDKYNTVFNGHVEHLV